ncbi:MAG: aminotransferase class I/II-fold pyridoxal phosphate-dependent enzyme [Erysipelotrichales bacterium]|nr:aminotransferase class I/II-fold pyridoxal phosphate-dependent enzyme [Erysipelotrichales bacterium]
MKQNKTPFFTKLKEYTTFKAAHFDVPGHKMGKINDEFKEYVGQNTLMLDVNAPRGLDTLNHPVGVIKEAQELLAEAFFAEHAYFLTNGTSQGIMTMIMAAVRAKEKIIMPRNVHKSIINGLILSGAIPIFVKPVMDADLGIANGMPLESVKQAILENPDAKAVFVINPTYFGVASDLKTIVDFAHSYDMVVLVDEAHGSHFAFNDQLPISAMQAKADMAACSTHKTIGSLTQSSVLLLQGKRITPARIRTILNIISTTSPSSLLMGSIDVARKNIYNHGKKELDRIIALTADTRERINKISGIKAILPTYFKESKFEYDLTKIIIKVSDLGISGFEAYKELFDESRIQVELAETHLILALFSIASSQQDADQLVEALEKLAENHRKNKNIVKKIFINNTFPEVYTRPREAAVHAPIKYVLLEEAIDEIAAESIMIYPPGIPIVIPGEIMCKSVIDDLKFYIEQGSTILSDTEDGTVKVVDKEIWFKWREEQ